MENTNKPQVDFTLLNFSDYLEKVDERDNLVELYWEHMEDSPDTSSPYDKELSELNVIINNYEENFKLFFKLMKNSKFAYKASKELYKK